MEIEISKYTPYKINSLPQDIQKLVWRALFYSSQIEVYLRNCSLRRDCKPIEKIEKYFEAFENIRRIIDKKCKKMGLEKIILCWDKEKNKNRR